MQKLENNLNWSFPDVNYLIADELTGYRIDAATLMKDEQIAQLKNEVSEKNTEIEQLNAKIADIHDLYKDQLNYMNKLIQTIQSELPVINKNHSELITFVIKKFVRKIIHREIELDPAIIKEILGNLLDKLHHDGLITVEVSSKDFSMLQQLTLPASIKLYENENLEIGDMIVTSKAGGFMHKINDAIDLMMSNGHEQG